MKVIATAAFLGTLTAFVASATFASADPIGASYDPTPSPPPQCQPQQIGQAVGLAKDTMNDLPQPDGGDPTTLQNDLTLVESVESQLNMCQDKVPASIHDVTMVGMYTQRRWRVTLLARMHRLAEARQLAQSTLSDVSAYISTHSATMNARDTKYFTVLNDWLVNGIASLPSPAPNDTVTVCEQSNQNADDYLKGEIVVAKCLAHNGKRYAAIKELRGALHRGYGPLGENSAARAYGLLANLENQAGDRRDAQTHIAEAYDIAWRGYDSVLVDDLANEFRAIAPAAYHQVLAEQHANERAAYEEATDGMSVDQKKIYDEEGKADHIETFDAAGDHQETWWYSDGKGGYRVGYTFVNGHLTSVYKP